MYCVICGCPCITSSFYTCSKDKNQHFPEWSSRLSRAKASKHALRAQTTIKSRIVHARIHMLPCTCSSSLTWPNTTWSSLRDFCSASHPMPCVISALFWCTHAYCDAQVDRKSQIQASPKQRSDPSSPEERAGSSLSRENFEFKSFRSKGHFQTSPMKKSDSKPPLT